MNFEPVCGGGFTRIFRFRMSSDCGGARSLLRRDDTAELVAWDGASLVTMRYSSPLWTATWSDVARAAAELRNLLSESTYYADIICSMLSCTYYAHFDAGIISAHLVVTVHAHTVH